MFSLSALLLLEDFSRKSECACQLGKIWHLLDFVPWKWRKKKIGSLIKQHVCLFIPSIPPRVAGSFQSSDRPLPSFLKVISQSAASGCRKCHVGFWVYKGWESHSGYICSFSVWFWVVTPYCQHYSSLLLARAIIVLGWLTQRPLKTMKLIPLVFFCEDYSTEHWTEKNSSKIPQTIAPERNLFFRWH